MIRLQIFKKSKKTLPGFLPTLSYTLVYLNLLVILPLLGLVLYTTQMSFKEFINIINSPRVLAAFKISFGISFIAAVCSVILGSIISWVLVRYRFYGRRVLDSIIDLPFAIPTSVSGITLATLYSENGWIGYYLSKIGIYVAFKPLGIFLALVFIGFPFIVRAVQPALEEIDQEQEEAAAYLGASRWTTIRLIILPEILPSIVSGFSMAIARTLGEYGSVIFIAGNIPYLSEIVPLLIVIRLEQFDYLGATALAVTMLISSLLLLLMISFLEYKFVKKWKY